MFLLIILIILIILKPYKLHNFESGPSTKGTVTREDALEMYRSMQTIRRLETAAGNLYKEKVVRGFCHLYSGQEACAVGKKNKSKINYLISKTNQKQLFKV